MSDARIEALATATTELRELRTENMRLRHQATRDGRDPRPVGRRTGHGAGVG
jgi:hypothetical protein